MEKAKELLEKFKNQLKQANEEKTKLDAQMAQVIALIEQLKGAVYALELTLAPEISDKDNNKPIMESK